MNLKLYLFSFFVGFVLALGVWILILFNIDPYKADFISLSAFYASLLVWCFCFLSLIGYYFRIWFGNKEIVYANMPVAMRQGFLLSLGLVGLLVLQSIRVLTWWTAGVWIGVVMTAELYFRAKIII